MNLVLHDIKTFRSNGQSYENEKWQWACRVYKIQRFIHQSQVSGSTTTVKSCIKPFVAPEAVVFSLINCFINVGWALKKSRKECSLVPMINVMVQQWQISNIYLVMTIKAPRFWRKWKKTGINHNKSFWDVSVFNFEKISTYDMWFMASRSNGHKEALVCCHSLSIGMNDVRSLWIRQHV